jgi:hypothetical protein
MDGWMDGWIGVDGEAYLRRGWTLWRVCMCVDYLVCRVSVIPRRFDSGWNAIEGREANATGSS